MPRSPDGTFSLVTGNPVITGTTIESNWANTTMADVAQAMTESLSRTGEGGMLAPFKFADGTAAQPSFTYTNQTNIGFYRAGLNDMRQAVAGNDTVRFTSTGIEKWNANDTTFYAIPSSTSVYDAQVVLTDANAGNIGKPNIPNSADLNDEITVGFIGYTSSTLNTPSSFGSVLIVGRDSLVRTQIAMEQAGSNSMWIRGSIDTGATWNSWVSLASTDYVDDNFVDLTTNQVIEGVKTFKSGVTELALTGAGNNVELKFVEEDDATELANIWADGSNGNFNFRLAGGATFMRMALADDVLAVHRDIRGDGEVTANHTTTPITLTSRGGIETTGTSGQKYWQRNPDTLWRDQWGRETSTGVNTPVTFVQPYTNTGSINIQVTIIGDTGTENAGVATITNTGFDITNVTIGEVVLWRSVGF